MAPELALPRSEEELASVLREAARDGRRLAVYGGGRVRRLWPDPGPDVVRLGTGGLPARVAVNPANLTVRAAAGVTLAALQEALAAQGLWYPPAAGDTGASTVGGHVAAATAGTRRADGRVRDWVLGVRAVLADGRPLRAGGEMIKNVAGYDLVRLFTGAHGTLGVLTEVALRVAPRPEHVATLACAFATAEAAAAASHPLLRWPDGPAAVEILPDADAQGWQLLTRWEGDRQGVGEAAGRFRESLREGAAAGTLGGAEAEVPWQERDRRLFGLAADGALHLEAAVPLSATAGLWRNCARSLTGLAWFGTMQPTAGVVHLALPVGTPLAALADVAESARAAGGHLRIRTLPPWCKAPLPVPGPSRLETAVRAAVDPAGRFVGLAPEAQARQGGRTT